jgi:RNA polymerase sigma-70 factor, ECF subfamily
MVEASDEDLCERIAGSDQHALAELYDRNGRLAFSAAYRIAGSRPAAEDIVQIAFMKLWLAPDRYSRERGSFRSWFERLVTNLALDQARRDSSAHRARMAFSGEMPSIRASSDPLNEVVQRFVAADLRIAMTRLPGPQRQVLELAYFGGRSIPEIARALAVPVSTIKGRMRLAIQRMRRDLLPMLSDQLV